MASGLSACLSTSAPSSTSSSEEETLYCCAVGIPSRTDEKKLDFLRSWYQIPNDFNPRLVVCGEYLLYSSFWSGYI